MEAMGFSEKNLFAHEAELMEGQNSCSVCGPGEAQHPAKH